MNKKQQQVKRLAGLRGELDRSMKAQVDPGASGDTQRTIEAARKSRQLHGPLGEEVR